MYHSVNWNGKNIATIALPPGKDLFFISKYRLLTTMRIVCAAANDGVPDYVTSGQLVITDEDG